MPRNISSDEPPASRYTNRRARRIFLSPGRFFQVSAKYSFRLQSQDRRRDLPDKIIIGQAEADIRRLAGII